MIKDPAARVDVRLLAGLTGSYLVFHLLQVRMPSAGLWGLHFLVYQPAWARIVFVFLAIPVFIPGCRRAFLPLASRVGGLMAPGSSGRALISGLLGVSGLVAFYLWRPQVHLLGDGDLYLRELNLGIYDLASRSDRAPLGFWLLRLLHESGPWSSPEDTFLVLSGGAGVLYLVLAPFVAGSLVRHPISQGMILGMMVTQGFMQLFFGYVEMYALLFPLALVYLMVGLKALRRPIYLVAASLVVGLAVPLHLTMGALLPSLFVLAFVSTAGAPTYGRWGAVAGAAILSTGLSLLVLSALGLKPADFFAVDSGSKILPILSAPGFNHAYRLISPGHLFDLLNQYLLVAPAALLTIPCLKWKGWRPDRRTLFLSAAAAFPVLFTVGANPEIGAFRDWDVLAFPALPLVLWCGRFLFAGEGDPERAVHVGVLICGASVLHSALWITLNANPVAAEVRFEDALRTSSLSQHARSYGWETLAGLRRRAGRHGPALEAQQEALKANPENPRHWNAVGVLYGETRRPSQGARYFEKAVALDPGYAEAYLNLGNALNNLKQPDRALAQYERAIQLEPQMVPAYFTLGSTHLDLDQPDRAVGYLRTAVDLNPGLVVAHQKLGAAYLRMDKPDSVRIYLKRVLELAPNHPRAGSMRAWLEDHP